MKIIAQPFQHCLHSLLSKARSENIHIHRQLSGFTCGVQLRESGVANQGRRCHRVRVRCGPADSAGDAGAVSNRLENVVRRKQIKVAAMLEKLGPQGVDERLSKLSPASKANRLLELIAGRTIEGRTTVIAEVGRLSPAETPASLAARAAKLAEWGADAIAVCTDEEVSPDGALDLYSICQVARQVPVICKDWVLHPLQVADAVESGASGINVVTGILGRQGTPLLLGFTLSLGCDAIVEVVNLKEVQGLIDRGGAPLFGVNISIGLSVPIPGFKQDVAKNLVAEMPFGAASVVGVTSLEEAREMKIAGADAVWLKKDMLRSTKGLDKEQADKEIQTLMQTISYAMTGDD